MNSLINLLNSMKHIKISVKAASGEEENKSGQNKYLKK